MDPLYVKRELEKIDEAVEKNSERARAENPEAAAEWERLKERFQRQAEELQLTGRIAEDAQPADGKGPMVDPELIEFMIDEPLVTLTRRNYTPEDPWVNPDTEATEHFEKLLSRTKDDFPKDYNEDIWEGLAFAGSRVACLPFGIQAQQQLSQRQPLHRHAFSRSQAGRARMNPLFLPTAPRRRSVHLRAEEGRKEAGSSLLQSVLDALGNRTDTMDIDAGLLGCDAGVVFAGIFACGAVRAGAVEGAHNLFGLLKPLAVADGHLWESLNLGACISVVWVVVATLWGGGGRESVLIEPERAGYGALNAALVSVPVGILLALVVRGQPMEADMLLQTGVALPLVIAGWRFFLSSMQ